MKLFKTMASAVILASCFSSSVFAQAGTEIYQSSLKYHVMFETLNLQEAINNLNYSPNIFVAWKSVSNYGAPTTAPVYRCVIPGSYHGQEHFASRDVRCEGQINEGIYGYVFTTQMPGTVALFRAYCHNNEYGKSSHATFDSELRYNQYFSTCYRKEQTLGYVYPSGNGQVYPR
ncbi:MAG: hypothetical protein RL748_758 [Pseudomonadota bacterium]|jgi:hypothetical protein